MIERTYEERQMQREHPKSRSGTREDGGFSLATCVGLPAAAAIAAVTTLGLIKLALIDAGAFAIGDLRDGMLDWQIESMFSFLRYANFALFVGQLLTCCLLAFWTIRLARSIAEEAPLVHDVGWYGNAWCVPIVNLWRPFQGLRELWSRTGRHTRPSRWLMSSAWTAWVGHQVLCILGAVPFQPRSLAGQCWLVGLWMARDLVFVVGSTLGVVVIIWLTIVGTRVSKWHPGARSGRAG
ncbi:DUF4328 domain-containing protein [Nannocystaceae bacterium ST9]